MNDPATLGQLTGVIKNIITSAIYLAGVAAVVMLLVGGFQFLLAGGDKEATQKAGKTITYAISGLVLVVCSWLIILTLAHFLGFESTSNIFDFSVCLPGFSGPNCS